ncbi:peptidylprolyl isomerase [Cohnella sp. 56]|uniref:peptidylprolyl isomerase n=1 Tax=Cohnella sp. 56 TaxID=3113722 RepID=UPI0030E81A24
MDTSTVSLMRVHNRTLTLRQLLHRLRADVSLAAIERCREDLALECWAEALGLAADAAGLQELLVRFRRAHGLFTAEHTVAWLQARDMTLDELAAMLKPQALRAALASRLVTAEEIRLHFLECSHLFDRAEISVIATAEYGIAQELLFRMEEGADFHALARSYSSDAASAKSGGYVGLIGRGELDPEAAAAVFHASAGDVVGPFERRREYMLYLVEALYPAELDGKTEADIRERIFRDKLEAYGRTLEIDEIVQSAGKEQTP